MKQRTTCIHYTLLEATTLKLMLNTLLGKREQFDNTLFMPKHVDLPRLRMIQNKLICKSFKTAEIFVVKFEVKVFEFVCQHNEVQ